MATVSSLGITFNTTAGNKTVVATPALGDVIVVVVANTGRTTAQPGALTDNNAGGHGTYVIATSATKNTSADTLWIYIRADSIQSATSTTWTLAPSGGADTGGGLEVFKVTGMSITALAAARQVGKQDNQAAATPAPAFPAVGLTGNACIGAIFNATSPATMTAPTSWTESQDVGYSTPTTGLETAFRSSGNTSQTITWGSASASAFCSAVVELDTTVPLVYTETGPRLNEITVKRAVWARKLGRRWTRDRSGLLVPEYC